MPTVPYDESEIPADGVIIRRINPDHHVVWDGNRGCRRISSKAFTPSSGENGGMSVDIEAKIIAAGSNPREYVTTPVFTGSVHFLAGDARALALIVGYDPLPDNPHHGEIWGRANPARFTNAQKKGLHGLSRWYVALEAVEIR